MPGPMPAVWHWSSLVQAPHLKVPVAVSQIGVLPEQSLLLRQPMHWPALELVVLVLGTQNGVALGQASFAPPSGAPPSVALAPATTESQPLHWFCTQKALPAVGQSPFLTHSTQLPEVAQTGVVAGQALPPSAPLNAAQDTQVFCAEQNGTPLSLLHWLLVLQATHLAFRQ